MGIRIALCQLHIQWENKRINLEHAEKFVIQAAREHTDIILFPEMSFTGFSMNIQNTMDKNYETINYMQTLIKKHHIGIGFGWVKKVRNKAENHYTILNENGSIMIDYIKLHSFRYGGEQEQFISGDSIKSFSYKGVIFTPFICYDLRFPELFQTISKNTEVFIIAANWPQVRSLHWNCLLQARAIETQSYILGINCVGECGNINYDGSSVCIHPNGLVIDRLQNNEGIIYANVEKEEVNKVRHSFPIKKDRRPELYKDFY